MANRLTKGHESVVVNESGLRSVLGRPNHGYHRRIHDKATVPVHGFVRICGFSYGNKQTALRLVELFLERSGYWLNAPDREVSDLFIHVACRKMDYDALREWFIQRIERRP